MIHASNHRYGVTITDLRQPWAVVAIADGNTSGKTEIFGTP